MAVSVTKQIAAELKAAGVSGAPAVTGPVAPVLTEADRKRIQKQIADEMQASRAATEAPAAVTAPAPTATAAISEQALEALPVVMTKDGAFALGKFGMPAVEFMKVESITRNLTGGAETFTVVVDTGLNKRTFRLTAAQMAGALESQAKRSEEAAIAAKLEEATNNYKSAEAMESTLGNITDKLDNPSLSFGARVTILKQAQAAMAQANALMQKVAAEETISLLREQDLLHRQNGYFMMAENAEKGAWDRLMESHVGRIVHRAKTRDAAIGEDVTTLEALITHYSALAVNEAPTAVAPVTASAPAGVRVAVARQAKPVKIATDEQKLIAHQAREQAQRKFAAGREDQDMVTIGARQAMKAGNSKTWESRARLYELIAQHADAAVRNFQEVQQAYSALGASGKKNVEACQARINDIRKQQQAVVDSLKYDGVDTFAALIGHARQRAVTESVGKKMKAPRAAPPVAAAKPVNVAPAAATQGTVASADMAAAQALAVKWGVTASAGYAEAVQQGDLKIISTLIEERAAWRAQVEMETTAQYLGYAQEAAQAGNVQEAQKEAKAAVLALDHIRTALSAVNHCEPLTAGANKVLEDQVKNSFNQASNNVDLAKAAVRQAEEKALANASRSAAASLSVAPVQSQPASATPTAVTPHMSAPTASLRFDEPDFVAQVRSVMVEPLTTGRKGLETLKEACVAEIMDINKKLKPGIVGRLFVKVDVDSLEKRKKQLMSVKWSIEARIKEIDSILDPSASNLTQESVLDYTNRIDRASENLSWSGGNEIADAWPDRAQEINDLGVELHNAAYRASEQIGKKREAITDQVVYDLLHNSQKRFTLDQIRQVCDAELWDSFLYRISSYSGYDMSQMDAGQRDLMTAVLETFERYDPLKSIQSRWVSRGTSITHVLKSACQRAAEYQAPAVQHFEALGPERIGTAIPQTRIAANADPAHIREAAMAAVAETNDRDAARARIAVDSGVVLAEDAQARLTSVIKGLQAHFSQIHAAHPGITRSINDFSIVFYDGIGAEINTLTREIRIGIKMLDARHNLSKKEFTALTIFLLGHEGGHAIVGSEERAVIDGIDNQRFMKWGARHQAAVIRALEKLGAGQTATQARIAELKALARPEARSAHTLSTPGVIIKTQETVYAEDGTIADLSNLRQPHEITRQRDGRLVLTRDVSSPTGRWDIFGSSLPDVSRTFSGLLDYNREYAAAIRGSRQQYSSVVAEIFSRVQRLAPGEHLTVLDWGAGAAVCLTQIADALRELGIENRVRLVGFGNMYANNWPAAAAKGIDLIFDDASNLPKYFRPGEIDIMYSVTSIAHLQNDRTYQGNHYIDHLVNDVQPLLSAEGMVIHDDYNDANHPMLARSFDVTVPIGYVVGVNSRTRVVKLTSKRAAVNSAATVQAVTVARNGEAIRFADGRLIIVVTLPGRAGEPAREQAFYQSSGYNSGKPGQWLPFDGITAQMVNGHLNHSWFSKTAHMQGEAGDKDSPLYRYGNEELKAAGERLDAMTASGELALHITESADVRAINRFIGGATAIAYNHGYDQLDALAREQGTEKIDERVRAMAERDRQRKAAAAAAPAVDIAAQSAKLAGIRDAFAGDARIDQGKLSSPQTVANLQTAFDTFARGQISRDDLVSDVAVALGVGMMNEDVVISPRLGEIYGLSVDRVDPAVRANLMAATQEGGGLNAQQVREQALAALDNAIEVGTPMAQVQAVLIEQGRSLEARGLAAQLDIIAEAIRDRAQTDMLNAFINEFGSRHAALEALRHPAVVVQGVPAVQHPAAFSHRNQADVSTYTFPGTNVNIIQQLAGVVDGLGFADALAGAYGSLTYAKDSSGNVLWDQVKDMDLSVYMDRNAHPGSVYERSLAIQRALMERVNSLGNPDVRITEERFGAPTFYVTVNGRKHQIGLTVYGYEDLTLQGPSTTVRGYVPAGAYNPRAFYANESKVAEIMQGAAITRGNLVRSARRSYDKLLSRAHAGHDSAGPQERLKAMKRLYQAAHVRGMEHVPAIAAMWQAYLSMAQSKFNRARYEQHYSAARTTLENMDTFEHDVEGQLNQAVMTQTETAERAESAARVSAAAELERGRALETDGNFQGAIDAYTAAAAAATTAGNHSVALAAQAHIADINLKTLPRVDSWFQGLRHSFMNDSPTIAISALLAVLIPSLAGAAASNWVLAKGKAELAVSNGVTVALSVYAGTWFDGWRSAIAGAVVAVSVSLLNTGRKFVRDRFAARDNVRNTPAGVGVEKARGAFARLREAITGLGVANRLQLHNGTRWLNFLGRIIPTVNRDQGLAQLAAVETQVRVLADQARRGDTVAASELVSTREALRGAIAQMRAVVNERRALTSQVARMNRVITDRLNRIEGLLAQPAMVVTEVAVSATSVTETPAVERLEFADDAVPVTRRQAMGVMAAGVVGAAVVAHSTTAQTNAQESGRVVSVPQLAYSDDLLGRLSASMNMGTPMTRARLQRSIALSNSPQYQALVGSTYDYLARQKIGDTTTRFAVLFVEGLQNGESFAMALSDLRIIVVSKEVFTASADKETRERELTKLAAKVAHEGRHIRNHIEGKDACRLADEALAYRDTYFAVAAEADLARKSHAPKAVQEQLDAVTEAQKLVYGGFAVLTHPSKRQEVCEGLGIPVSEFNNVYYSDIDIPPDQTGRIDVAQGKVGILLTYRNEPVKTVWVDITGAKKSRNPADGKILNNVRYERIQIQQRGGWIIPATFLPFSSDTSVRTPTLNENSRRPQTGAVAAPRPIRASEQGPAIRLNGMRLPHEVDATM
ncbi:MAG: hypothetical protein WCG78_03725 [Candidatus Omnitrophota bacterium]